MPCLFLKVGEFMKRNRILSLVLALIILMSCVVFVIPVNAAPPTYYPKLNIRVTKTEEDNAYVAFKTHGASDGEIIYEWSNNDEDYHTLDGGNYLNVEMDCSEYFYYVHVDEYYRHPMTGVFTLLNSVTISQSSYDFWYKEDYYYDISFVRGDLRPEDEYSYCVSNPDLFFYPVKTVDVSGYSSILKDLEKDPLFKIADYPSIADDYSLDVVQIAESVDGELFVYVYNPSDATVEVEAAKINMSLQHYEDRSPSYQLYDLTLVSTSGTLDKYVVNDFTVSDDDYRYYNIAGIYTPFNENIHDSAQQDDDVINYVVSSVGKCFAAYTYNEKLIYECVDVDVVEVDIKSTGSIRYSEGIKSLGVNATDSHFVAFSIDNYDVKRIYDATITYTLYDHYYTIGSGIDPTPYLSNYRTVTDDIYEWERGNVDGSWLFGYDYNWKRIQTIAEFNVMLQDNTNEYIDVNQEQLNGSEFVFLFTETDYEVVIGAASGTVSYSSTRVDDVAILRLHFATPTNTYNLGVVSNILSDDGEPDFEVGTGDNIQNWGEDAYEDLEIILSIILLLALIVALPHIIKFIKSIYYGIRDGITTVIEFVVAIFVTPFELLGSLFGGGKSTKTTKKRKGQKRGKRK